MIHCNNLSFLFYSMHNPLPSYPKIKKERGSPSYRVPSQHEREHKKEYEKERGRKIMYEEAKSKKSNTLHEADRTHEVVRSEEFLVVCDSKKRAEDRNQVGVNVHWTCRRWMGGA